MFGMFFAAFVVVLDFGPAELQGPAGYARILMTGDDTSSGSSLELCAAAEDPKSTKRER